MVHFVGLDVSVKETSACVVDDAGKVILEQKVPTEPADIIALLSSLGVTFCRIGIEAGPLSQWLVNALTAAELPGICVETRHMKALLTAPQINKTDRNDACVIAHDFRGNIDCCLWSASRFVGAHPGVLGPNLGPFLPSRRADDEISSRAPQHE